MISGVIQSCIRARVQERDRVDAVIDEQQKLGHRLQRAEPGARFVVWRMHGLAVQFPPEGPRYFREWPDPSTKRVSS